MVKRYKYWEASRADPEVLIEDDADCDFVHYVDYQFLQAALAEALSAWESWNSSELEGSRGWLGQGEQDKNRIAELRKQFLDI